MGMSEIGVSKRGYVLLESWYTGNREHFDLLGDHFVARHNLLMSRLIIKQQLIT